MGRSRSHFLLVTWFLVHKASSHRAAIQAMLVNRVGHFRLALGIMVVFTIFQTVDFLTNFLVLVPFPNHYFIFCNMRFQCHNFRLYFTYGWHFWKSNKWLTLPRTPVRDSQSTRLHLLCFVSLWIYWEFCIKMIYWKCIMLIIKNLKVLMYCRRKIWRRSSSPERKLQVTAMNLDSMWILNLLLWALRNTIRSCLLTS